MQRLELLAPAKNLEVGLAAIDHGADAVYIGAAHHGARAAAGNSIADIGRLCDYAHRFGATVHVTVNTLVYASEMDEALRLVAELAQAGADALLIQDLGLLVRVRQAMAEGRLPQSLQLHASTQCDSRTPAKVAWLASQGFHRVVLARELSVAEVARIHQSCPDVELECFVHGALCVSYSGLCYASQACFHRSANRGECAQFCRLAFRLHDDRGHEVGPERHYLSLKDLCLIEQLESLAEAGATAFKIEGRLKDTDYVKNVVSAYSQKLDNIVARHPERYVRASRGSVDYRFTPDLHKTFNRGYTTYFAQGRQPGIANFDTPKALGEYVGRVKELRGASFTVAGTASFANGDGLCFLAPSTDGSQGTELVGFRVNRAEGNRLFPFKMPRHLHPGLRLYRNSDEAFQRLLAGTTAVRTLPIRMRLRSVAEGLALRVESADNEADGVETVIELPHEEAQKPQHDNIVRNLSKLGGTSYRLDHLDIAPDCLRLFIPSSRLAELRRQAIEAFAQRSMPTAACPAPTAGDAPEPPKPLTSTAPDDADGHALSNWATSEHRQFPYIYNIANPDATAFYRRQGLPHPSPAFELLPASGSGAPADSLIMQCRHCLRYALGHCVRHGGTPATWHEPLHLSLPDGRRFRLEFHCGECQMNVYAETQETQPQR